MVSGLMRLQHGAQLLGIEVGDHKDLLGHGAFAGHQLVTTSDRGRHPQLKRLAASTHTADHGRRNRLDALFLGQALQPGNQPINVGAVGDDNPAQISKKPRDRRDPSQPGYAKDSSVWSRC